MQLILARHGIHICTFVYRSGILALTVGSNVLFLHQGALILALFVKMEDANGEANAKFKYINETFLSHFGQIKPKSFRSNNFIS